MADPHPASDPESSIPGSHEGADTGAVQERHAGEINFDRLGMVATQDTDQPLP